MNKYAKTAIELKLKDNDIKIGEKFLVDEYSI